MKIQKILALDFDGCIVDSIMEALFISYSSYREHINRKTHIFDNKEPRVDNFLNLISNYPSQVNKFKNLRHYIKDAYDYAVILYIIENNLKVNSKEEFFKIKQLIPKKNMDNYYAYFYDKRKRVSKENFDAWAKLTPGFSCINKIRKLTGKYKTLIATTNDKESIIDLLAKPYLNLNIKKEDIVDRHISTDKIIQMEYICKNYNVKFKDIHFVDDNLDHLLKTQKLGVNVYLASWGYCTKKQKIIARKEKNVTLLTQQNLYSVLNKSLNQEDDNTNQ